MITLPQQKERILLFNKEVSQSTIGDLSKHILEINEDDRYINSIYNAHNINYTPPPIKIYIDSYGGSVYQCFGLLSIIENSTTPIHTIVTGCAMSCGFLISIAGHTRFSYKNSTFMYHQISSAVYGELKDIKDTIIEVDRLQELVETHTLTHTGISRAELNSVYDKKTNWYMTSKQALKYKVVDKIL